MRSVGQRRRVVGVAHHAIQHSRANVLAAHAEGDDVEIARNLRVRDAYEAIDRVGLEQRLLVDVERLRGDKGLPVRRWDIHALAKLLFGRRGLRQLAGRVRRREAAEVGVGQDRGLRARGAGGGARRGQSVQARHELGRWCRATACPAS